MTDPSGDASTIKFGAGLTATDEGAGVVRVDTTTGLTLITEQTRITDGNFDIDFGGFPAITDYRDLIGVMFLRSTSTAGPVAAATITFNNDDAANYYTENLQIFNAGAASYQNEADNYFIFTIPGNPPTPGSGPPVPGEYAHVTFTIPGFSSTQWKKTLTVDNFFFATDTTADNVFMHELYAGLWNNTAAVDRLIIKARPGQFVTHSHLRLYGRA